MKTKTLRRELAGYISLNVLGMIGLSCYILADTYFIAKGMGAKGLAALNLAIAVYSFIHGSGLMIGIGGATRFTILKAQGKDQEADKVFMQSIFVGTAAGIFFLLLGIFASGALAKLLGANADIFALTNVYLKTLMCFSPCFILNNVCLAFVRNDGNPNLSMVGMVSGSLCNIVLDYVFIFPLGLGMFGAALATGLAPVVSLGILSIHKIKKRNQFHLCKKGFSVRGIGSWIGLGISALVNELSSGVALITFNLLILGIAGNIGVAAYGIIANVSLVVVSVFTGIGQGIQPVVSRIYGQNERNEIRRILKDVICLSFVIAVVLYGALCILAQPLVAAFNTEKNQVLGSYAHSGVYIYFFGILFAGINVAGAAFLSAVEQARYAFLISVMRGLIILVPMAWVLSSLFQMNGIWSAFPAAEAVTFIAAICGFRSVLKKLPKNTEK